jgi:hypothetical protein
VRPAEFEKELVPLRTEILECEKARIDLLKYKLLTIAVLGSIGLGLNDKINDQSAVIAPVYILCIIPFACIFVDSLCMHNNLRIVVIAKFLKEQGDLYERFVLDVRKRSRFIFSLEDFALHVSSILVSIILIGLGIWKSVCALIITGIVGVMMILTLYLIYRRLRASI